MLRVTILVFGSILMMSSEGLAQDEINGCVKDNGQLRIVESSDGCDSGESSIALVGVVPGPPVRTFLGCSADAVLGGVGVFRMNEACQSTFGPNSIMCNSVQILNSPNPPLAGDRMECWTKPTLVPVSAPNDDKEQPVVVDASGVSNMEDGVLSKGVLSCRGWRINAGDPFRGLVVSGNGEFNTRLCNSSRNVACCAPLSP